MNTKELVDVILDNRDRAEEVGRGEMEDGVEVGASSPWPRKEGHRDDMVARPDPLEEAFKQGQEAMSGATLGTGAISVITSTVGKLASALERAAKAHHLYEGELGAPDPGWPLFYAIYIDLEARLTIKDALQHTYRALTIGELVEEVKRELKERERKQA